MENTSADKMRLRIEKPEGEVSEREFSEETISVGRTKSNAIRIKDDLISREHCRLERRDGRWTVVDLGSANGTRVNGETVDRRELQPGDVIHVGHHKLTFLGSGASPATAQPPEGTSPAVADSDERRETARAEKVRVEPGHDVAKPSESTAHAEPGDRTDGAPVAEPRYVLEIMEGPDAPRTIEIGREPLTLGRAKSNVFVLQDDAASNYHAEIVREPIGYVLSDLGSTNGTKLNGEKIVKQPLVSGARIEIGRTVMIFKNVGAPVADEVLFGTVLLDGSAPTPAPSDTRPGHNIRRILTVAAALVAVGALVGAAVAIWRRPEKPIDRPTPPSLPDPDSPPGNLIMNASFDQEAKVGEAVPKWDLHRQSRIQIELAPEEDHRTVALVKGALAIHRMAQAAPNAYAYARQDVPWEKGRGFRIQCWVKSIAMLSGQYGIALHWVDAAGDEIAVDSTWVLENLTKWRNITMEAGPPADACAVWVGLESIGNEGTVYFDGLSVVSIPDPGRTELRVASSGVSTTLDPRGMATVFRDGARAARGVQMILVSGDVSAGLEFARPDIPQSGADKVSALGILYDFAHKVRVDYQVESSAVAGGVRMLYKMYSQEGLIADRAELRLILPDAFVTRPPEIFRPNGERIEATEGRSDGAAEVHFSGRDKFVLAFPEGRTCPVNVRALAHGFEVTVILGNKVKLGEQPVEFDVLFLSTSRLLQSQAHSALAKIQEAAGKEDFAGAFSAIERFLKEFDAAFATERARAEEIRSRLTETAEKIALDSVRRAAQAMESRNTDAFPTLLAEAREKLTGAKTRLRDTPYVERIEKALRDLAQTERERTQTARNREAEELYQKAELSYKNNLIPVALSFFNKILLQYGDTPSAQRVKDERWIDKLKKHEDDLKLQDAWVKDVLQRAGFLALNGKYPEAIATIRGDPKFEQYGKDPRIVSVLEEYARKAGP